MVLFWVVVSPRLRKHRAWDSSMGGRFSYGNCSQGVAGFVPGWLLVNTCFSVCCHSAGKLRGPDLWARLCQKLDHFRHEQAEKYLLPLLCFSAVPAGRDFKLKRKKKAKFYVCIWKC